MQVLVTGGTGLIGRPVCQVLQAAGHTVTVVSREPGRVPARSIGWDAVGAAMAETDAIVNLAGEHVGAGRWTPARKARIRQSRFEATRVVVRAIAAAPRRPRVLINASAAGYYGPRGEEPLDETAPPGTDFLARVCQAWEAEALSAEAFDVRVVLLRIGVVLTPDGGALAAMLIPFRACLGGPLGNGRQWMSWVHRDDVVGIVRAALGHDGYRGPVNATAPEPVTNRAFSKVLGRVLHRPVLVRVPRLPLRLVLGEMASMLLTGQRVLPAVAQRLGYRFAQPELDGALRACVG